MKSLKPKVWFGKIQQVYDGKPVKYYYRKNRTAVEYSICCDCGLVHLVEYKPLKSCLVIRAWRDEERTKWRRKLKRRRQK